MKLYRTWVIGLGLLLAAMRAPAAAPTTEVAILPAAVLDKAEAILVRAEVFATARFGPNEDKRSEEAWAFSAILKHSDDPGKRLARVLNEATPAGALYCLLGLHALGDRATERASHRLSVLRRGADLVTILQGQECEEDEMDRAWEKLETMGPGRYVLDPLPDFFATQRIVRTSAWNQKVRTEKDVVVGRLTKPIPEEDRAAWDFIWNEFSRRPETHSFQHYTGKDWRTNYDRFAAALVAKAKEKKYEAESLQAALTKLLTEPVAQAAMKTQTIGYLPIEAHRTTRGTREVWVIFCLWEYATDPRDMQQVVLSDFAGETSQPKAKKAPAEEPPDWLELAHIRMFTYDLKTGELIGYVTCG